MDLSTLYLIPARGGSKGIPGKNTKPLGGQPLLHYSIAYARQFAPDSDICLSTDDEGIIACAAEIGLSVPFTRPAELATDTAGSFPVMHHALNFFERQGRAFDALVLLQPTSPFREKRHLDEMLRLLDAETEAVVSVRESKANPYFNLFEETDTGYLHLSKGTGFARRQDVPPVYAFNGSLYVFRAPTLKKSTGFQDLHRIKKYVMDGDRYSIDLDTPLDWLVAEALTPSPSPVGRGEQT
jgi:N-acylneuraminate cytidylyltransferase